MTVRKRIFGDLFSLQFRMKKKRYLDVIQGHYQILFIHFSGMKTYKFRQKQSLAHSMLSFYCERISFRTSEDMPLKCETCDRQFLSEENLLKHARQHALARNFCCKTCGKLYTTSRGLKLHTASAHCQQETVLLQEGGGSTSDVGSQQVIVQLIL